MEIKRTICPYDCPTSCNLLVEIKNDSILRVYSDQKDKVTGGLICKKMRHYEKSIYSKDRILTPLKRIGEKGSGDFKPITWDEAIKEITDKWKYIIDKDGPQSILPIYFSGVMGKIQLNCGDAFFNKMGACNLIKTLCCESKEAGYESIMGKTPALDPRELSESDFYIVWGSNMKATRIQALSTLVNERKKGKKVVLIEVCSEDMARYCDEVILIKPGTDGALALAMMNVMLSENLVDNEFISKNTIGYEDFKETLHKYTPNWAEKITGVPKEVIISLAKEYATSSSPAIILGSGNTRHRNGAMTTRLITILTVISGSWKNPGGGLCGYNPNTFSYIDTNRVTRPDFRKNTPRDININQISTALNNNEEIIKSVYVYASNPVGSVSNQESLIKGLLREDLFTVVHERFMTDTAKYADIILPATFSVEQTDCFRPYGYSSFGTSKKIINPPGECKSNWDTFCLLAKGMGYEDHHFDMSEEEMLYDLLSNPISGMDHLSKDEVKTLFEGGSISMAYPNHNKYNTESGKIEIVNYKSEEPIPYYKEIKDDEFPLKIIAIPSCHTLNSIFLERDDLVEKRGAMTLIINPKDAKKRNIKNGDKVICFNDLAEVEFVAKISDKIVEGAVASEGIFSKKTSENNKSINALHHDRVSDMGYATTINDNTVDVRKKL